MNEPKSLAGRFSDFRDRSDRHGTTELVPILDACHLEWKIAGSFSFVDSVENNGRRGDSHLGYTLGHPFDRSGLAAVSDLRSPEVQAIFRGLETVQEEFLAKEGIFRSPEYRWPRDPLHNWSRCWEYPYAFRQIQSFYSLAAGKEKIIAADLGSGVTFFPFAAARLGYEVVCTDTDVICDKDLSKAIPVVPHAPGKVSFRLISGGVLPFANGELDLVFCISVLEHIPDFPNTIREIARVLKPGGWLILTIDLDLRGDQEIGIEPYQLLLRELARDFEVKLPEVSIHPRDLLKTMDGPYPWPVRSGFDKYWFLLKQNILKPIFGKKPTPLIPFYLAVKGITLIRK